MATRDGALARAAESFDSGALKARLAELVAVPSSSQEPGREDTLHAYLAGQIMPWVQRLGFTAQIHPNPLAGFGPILTAERMEDPARPTILLYGHGDTVRGLPEQWSQGRDPWVLREEGELWYGRGTADNKGQHAINLLALEAVLAERGGKLGCNVKLVLEMAEERGSKGLREFVAANSALLAADALIASDGPRLEPSLPTIATGSRGSFNFELALKLRDGGVHSGHWGGLTTDPAVMLAHAICTMMDRNGKVLVRDWFPPGGVPANVRDALAGCEVGGGGDSATIDAGWGEPGLSSAEKIYGWNSLIVLAMLSGKPDSPVNAVAPDARAHCQIRYTVDSDTSLFEPALRRHLDAHGLHQVAVENAGVRMPASRTAPDHPWVRWAQDSMQKSLGKRVQIIPNASGGLPGDVFMDHLGVPLVWVPHSYNGCKQHGPDEHMMKGPAREGLLAFAGMGWDAGEAGTPARK
jgi:acetylornithine deacetylase/succinyl-diaminopimelate desuccinylase-like protein